MASIDPSHYQHPLDRQTLATLRAIPAFPALTKAFMKFFNERIVYIETKSNHVQITPDHLPEIHRLLPPLCERLGIAVPDLYLVNDRTINACTTNESNPVIMLNSGCLECCSPEVVETILAHECGHIASHHVLYQMMGSVIMSGAASIIPGVGSLVGVGLQVAFLAWSRASEYTADRAAAIAVGDPERVVDCCISLSGGYDSLDIAVDKERFMDQALEYESSIGDDGANKVFESVMMALGYTHPLNAYRALEASRWGDTDEFSSMQAFLEHFDSDDEAPWTGVNYGQPWQPPSQTVAPGGSGPFLPTGAPVRFCGACGTKVEPGQVFCTNCGKKLV